MQIDQHRKISVAPMMDWTDRHCRFFHRVISRQTLLYTEMVTSAALIRGGALRLLDYNPQEHPVALQLGGSDPDELAAATKLGVAHGYDEINLNVGCPSDRVQSGRFGAVLMLEPQLVADCLAAMVEAAGDVPVTMKCRIGVDDQEPSETLPEFLAQTTKSGITHVIIHARKAWLQGLSPKENRTIPPLDYDLVQRMAAAFPQMRFSINGGIETLDQAKDQLDQNMQGVMIGRAAYHDPYTVLAGADQLCDPTALIKSRTQIIEEMRPYIAQHLQQGGRLHQITRHMLGLFQGQPGARSWRRILSEGVTAKDAGLEVIDQALDALPAEARSSLT